MANYVVWFDIPVTDLERASRFYTHVLGTTIERADPGMPMGVFSHQGDQAGGCLFQDADFRPSENGPLLYFNVNGRMDTALAQTEANGGKILQPKHAIGPYGFRSVVLDSEGNRIALHSESE
jgi:predicted enzyme related to lactoylglutathione lyase